MPLFNRINVPLLHEPFAVNGLVATEPLPSGGIAAQEKSAFTTIAQKKLLAPLKVVLASADYRLWPGDIVYVCGDSGVQPWAKQRWSLADGREFILVPEAAIQLVSLTQTRVMDTSSSTESKQGGA